MVSFIYTGLFLLLLFLAIYFAVVFVFSASYLDWIVIILYIMFLDYFVMLFYVSKQDVTVYICCHEFSSDIVDEHVGSSWR